MSSATYRLGARHVRRMGYGAMQLAGPHVFGPPKDRAACVAVLRAAVEAGVDHIDTCDYYGPHITNQIIREALHPYPDDLVIVTKVGALRGDDGSWNPAQSTAELIAAVDDNRRNLDRDVIEVVNLRIMGGGMMPSEGSIAARVDVLAALQAKGVIGHIGLSNVTPTQVAEARRIVAVACVQNLYNIATRGDDALVDDLAAAGIAYVPYFPLGGSARSSRPRCPPSPRELRRPRFRSRWRGSSRGRRTSCSSPAHRQSRTLTRTSRRRR